VIRIVSWLELLLLLLLVLVLRYDYLLVLFLSSSDIRGRHCDLVLVSVSFLESLVRATVAQPFYSTAICATYHFSPLPTPLTFMFCYVFAISVFDCIFSSHTTSLSLSLSLSLLILSYSCPLFVLFVSLASL
jgi:hypothetical protein